ncbi:uncharacterized protein METZ01_LOCUS338899, partial [marine metagenome]
DGETWTAQTSGITNNLNGVTSGNGTFVAVGLSGGTILTSTDGETWTPQTSGFSGFRQVTYVNGTFVITGNSGMILTSPDGETWTQQTSGTSAFLN